MSLALVATGYKRPVRIGYRHFSLMRQGIAAAYSPKHGELYDEIISFRNRLDFDKIVEQWNDGCNDDLDILLMRSDCDGQLSVDECRRVLRVLKTLQVSFEDEVLQKNYSDFLDILMHCVKKRVIMRFC